MNAPSTAVSPSPMKRKNNFGRSISPCEWRFAAR